ncbi:sigma-70 family RNA polymerase sigma factor [Acinetobacter qingfengensis]|uniref:RNA polymerase subunit sigma n=1 Tax=Acinetobacter qingfengensis TaxID=1262585 RepID=A0A1E7RA42_9GAMM|nr:sigma-70 family RNA polymerase sigma factor [Acinetobacter qingfengensis]KAA8730885.1 sigma-70 family RNA polymerase sigma factor [Acinetobacter qingfengensis]OEY96145.1 RNA polymerase subunit sigma [Acinetobacter qingfengensis]
MRDPVERLYMDHHSWVYQWLKKRLSNNEDAADLAQDTFVRILRRKEHYYFDQPRALLTTIAKGLLINWYQRQAIEQAYLEALSAQPERYDDITPEQRLQAIEALCLINRILNEMPERQRQTFIWSQLEGLTQQDIAQRQGVSTRTVMRDLVSAMTLCLSIMDDDS